MFWDPGVSTDEDEEYVGEIKKNIAQRSIISCIDKSPGSARVKMGKFLLGPYFGNIHFEFGLDTGLTLLQTSYRNSVSVTPNYIPTHPSSSILGNFDRWLSADTKIVTLILSPNSQWTSPRNRAKVHYSNILSTFLTDTRRRALPTRRFAPGGGVGGACPPHIPRRL